MVISIYVILLYRFLKDVNDLYPDVTLSIGWTTGCCSEQYTAEHVQSMWDIVKVNPFTTLFYNIFYKSSIVYFISYLHNVHYFITYFMNLV